MAQRATRRGTEFGISWFLLVLCLGMATPALAQWEVEQEPICYSKSVAVDPVARLQRKLKRGEVTLKYEQGGLGYIRSVLEQLKVPVESQALVFSKTSFQHTRIAPRTPRAIYFSDDMYVGFVKNGDVLEFAAVDPNLGATFYTLDQQESDRPQFQRHTDTCLQCHASSRTQNVPGHLIRSVFPDRSGLPVYNAGSYVTDHTSEMKNRWGGWYVTGTHGSQRHMGNTLMEDRDHPKVFDYEIGANRLDLKGLVNTGPYLSPHSDIVALMVLEHQTQMHNLITQAGYQARMAKSYDDGLNKAFGRPENSTSESSERRIKSYSEKMIEYLLFSDEAKLTDRVEGTSGFAEVFSRQGPRDHKGRSLRDLDLKTRLFRYPCSYLIYSEAFEKLPQPVLDQVYKRLREILTGQDKRPEFAHLSKADRQNILEILLDTKKDLPKDWDSLRKPNL